MRFVTQKIVAGELKLAGVMPGAECTAQTTTKIVVVGSSALRVYGVRRLAHQIMAGRFDGLSTTVLPGKTGKYRFAT
jgi:hypothetical protein